MKKILITRKLIKDSEDKALKTFEPINLFTLLDFFKTLIRDEPTRPNDPTTKTSLL